MGYYISNKNIMIKPLPGSPFESLDELYECLCLYGWNELTVFKHSQWNPSNKACGQCNGTVILVKKFFGGDILYYDEPGDGKKGHYFNRINGVGIDLTSEQFSRLLDYSSIKGKPTNWSNLDNIKYFSYAKSSKIMELSMGLHFDK